MRPSSPLRSPWSGFALATLACFPALASAQTPTSPYFTRLDLSNRYSLSYYNARLGQTASVLVNDDWSVISGSSAVNVTSDGSRAFRWTRGTGVQNLGQLGSSGSFLRGMSADGAVLYGDSQLSSGVGTPSTFVWDSAGGMRAKGSSALLGSITPLLAPDRASLFGVATQTPDVLEFFRADVNGTGETRSGALGTGNHLRLTDLSANGRVAIGTTRIGNETQVVRWAEGGLLASLGTIGGGRTQVVGMNSSGTDIVGSGTAANAYNYAFRWTESGGMQKLAPSDIAHSAVSYVSDDAQTVVGTFEGRFGNRLFRSTPGGGFVDLGHLGSYNTYLLGIYDGGDRVYGMTGAALYDNSHIVRWTPGQGLLDLSVPGATNTTLGALSGDGSVTILTGTKNSVNRVYRRTEDGAYADLGKILGQLPSVGLLSTRGDRMIASVSPDGTNSRLYHWTGAAGFRDMGLISGATSASVTLAVDDLQLVAGVSRVGTADRAWLWDGTYGMSDLQTLLTGKGLDLSGWDSLNKIELLEVRGGVAYLTGLGTYNGQSNTKFHAIVPEPSSLVALGGLAVIALRRRRRSRQS